MSTHMFVRACKDPAQKHRPSSTEENGWRIWIIHCHHHPSNHAEAGALYDNKKWDNCFILKRGSTTTMPFSVSTCCRPNTQTWRILVLKPLYSVILEVFKRPQVLSVSESMWWRLDMRMNTLVSNYLYIYVVYNWPNQFTIVGTINHRIP